jgi:hypothetical protein
MNYLPDPKTLRQLLDYDPETGVLVWNSAPRFLFDTSRGFNIWNAKFPGKVAGTTRHDGYVSLTVRGARILAHHVAWIITHGVDCDFIDHIDGNPSNNRIRNLRDATMSMNARNAAKPTHNTSGYIGVSWYKRRQKWLAHITISNRQIYLGLHNCIEDAIAARKAAEREYGFHPNHGREKQ